jgi:hypothetical protein
VIYTAAPIRDSVSLDAWEVHGAVERGLQQRADARGWKEYADNKPEGEDGARLQCLGQIAERAIAKRLNRYWLGLSGVGKAPDLEPNIEVRLIGVPHYGLRVRQDDIDTRIVIGIIIPRGDWIYGLAKPPWAIPGWITAGAAKRAEWMMNPFAGRPMYAVPQQFLHPLRR